MSEYYLKNRESILEKSREYYLKRKEKDPEFYLKRKITDYTDEDKVRDLIQMKKNIEWIKYLRTIDKRK
jgi:hypothetical protein